MRPLATRTALSLTLGLFATLLAPVLAPAPAYAVYEVCNPYTLQQFRDQMAAMEKAFESFDLNEARYQAETAEKEARCVDSPVTAEDIGRFAVLRARMHFLDSKTDEAAEWMLVAMAAVGGKAFDGIGEEDPLRLVLREIDISERSHATYKGNALPPAGGFMLHNGRLMQQPAGWSGVRGLVQVFDKKSARVEGFWVFGADFSGSVEKQYVAAGGAPYKAPKTWTGPGLEAAPNLEKVFNAAMGGGGDEPDPVDPTPPSDGDPVIADPGTKPDEGGNGGKPDEGGNGGKPPKEDGGKPPKEDAGKPPKGDGGADTGKPPKGSEGPVAGGAEAIKPPKAPKPPGDGPNGPLLSTGIGLVALSGAMYGIGYAVSSAPLNAPYTGDQLANRRSTANMLVLGSAISGVAGLGIGVAGLVSHDGAGLGLRGRW